MTQELWGARTVTPAVLTSLHLGTKNDAGAFAQVLNQRGAGDQVAQDEESLSRSAVRCVLRRLGGAAGKKDHGCLIDSRRAPIG